MYPRNAASPPRIAIGAVVQISDGAVQSSGVSIAVRPNGGAETAGGGTTAYGGSSNIVYYTPTQAETDYTDFVVVAYKTGCIPVAQTIITSASATAGYAGTDQGKIANATSTVNLSGTTIKTATDVETDTADIQSRLPAALTAGGNIKADTLALSGDTVAADNAEAFFDGTGYAGTNNVIPTVTTLTGHTPQTGDTYALANGANGFVAIKADTAAIKTKTDQLTFTTANQVDATTVTIATGAVSAAALAADAGNEIADAVLDRNMATGTDSGSPTVRTPRQALRLLRNKTAIAAGTMTVNKEDDSTASWTAAVTTAAGNPIDSIDPAGP